MSSAIRVRPTKIELIRLRRRLRTSIRVHKILSERLIVLVNEFMARLREVLDKRLETRRALSSGYARALMLLGVYGPSLADYLWVAAPKPRVYVGTENIMGVKVRSAVIKYEETRLPPGLEDFVVEARRILEAIVDLAKTEQALYALGKEIAATKRKSKALEHIVIPRLRNTIRMLQMRFDEKDREEKARMKRIKQMLVRRGGPWKSETS